MPARHVGEPRRQLECLRVVGDGEGARQRVRARRLVVGHRREASGGFATLGGCSRPGGGRCSTSRAGGASDAGRCLATTPSGFGATTRSRRPISTRSARAEALLPERPLLSVVLPVGGAGREDTAASIESLLDQAYENWELWVTVDAARPVWLGDLVADAARRGARVEAVPAGRGARSRPRRVDRAPRLGLQPAPARPLPDRADDRRAPRSQPRLCGRRPARRRRA